MAAAMPGEKGHAVSLELADDERIRWRAEWRIDAQLARPGQPRHGVEAAAADDPDAHGLPADRFASRLLPSGPHSAHLIGQNRLVHASGILVNCQSTCGQRLTTLKWRDLPQS